MILIENIAKLMNAYFEGRGGQNYSVARILPKGSILFHFYAKILQQFYLSPLIHLT